MSHNQILGKTGEDIAGLFFEEKGYTVVHRNWRCRAGEIDLIVKKGDEWRFIEVKMRSGIKYGYPEEAVTEYKSDNFYNAISEYLLKNPEINEDKVHADILAIILNDKEFDIRWIEDGV
ncbi:MAG: YraN family protein [Patescibacteria group bacterium]|nr:YraN family protein [Patescibacteria group bacterium]